ncbi:hypothetical protein P7C70_g6030, partial [Phenoliferia sp. Uapishka_3]
MTVSPLPNPTRFVTTTSSNGESSNMIAAPVEMATIPGSSNRSGNVWRTEKFPAEVQGEVDTADKGKGMMSSGSVLRYVDYAIVTVGSIEHETSDGKVITMAAGDTLVQRGTLHAWHNRTDEWTLPVLIDGKPLQGTQFK